MDLSLQVPTTVASCFTCDRTPAPPSPGPPVPSAINTPSIREDTFVPNTPNSPQQPFSPMPPASPIPASLINSDDLNPDCNRGEKIKRGKLNAPGISPIRTDNWQECCAICGTEVTDGCLGWSFRHSDGSCIIIECEEDDDSDSPIATPDYSLQLFETEWIFLRHDEFDDCFGESPSPSPTPVSDQCPNNAHKEIPGLCGCNELDVDDDANGIIDCFEDDDPQRTCGDCLSVHDGPGCSEPDVMDCVGRFDAFCPLIKWDESCIAFAINACDCINDPGSDSPRTPVPPIPSTSDIPTSDNCSCDGKSCGLDSCGGSCGSCPPGRSCTSTGRCRRG